MDRTMKQTRRTFQKLALACAMTLFLGSVSGLAAAATAEDLDKDAAQALRALYKINPTAALISRQAKAILVFPKIIKAGLFFGGSYGEGVLMKGSRVTVVVVNEGVARNLSTTTLKDDAYAFITDRQGLMASISIEGTKISRIKR